MSSRWYPIYRKGNPQLRIFLPNFWMKIVPPKYESPSNVVEFHVPIQMTQYDVVNYLQKIYKINVKDVRTRIQLGRFRRALEGGYIIKDEDIKVAYVILDKNEKFKFPDIFNQEEKDKEQKVEQKNFELMKKGFENFLEKNNKPGVPGWFGI